MDIKNSKNPKACEIPMENLTSTATTKDTIKNKSTESNGKKKDNDNDRNPYYPADSDIDF